MKKTALLFAGLLTATTAFGAAYKIPEQSTRSTGTAAAYFATADAPDTAYYNPAGMSWLKDENRILVETGAKYIYLPSIKFKGYTIYKSPADAKTTKEYFLIPYIHIVSKKLDRVRLGFSFVAPYGLSKRWSTYPQSATAREFTLGVLESNMTISYNLDNRLSLGAGLRIGYATGKIKFISNETVPGIYDLKLKGNSSLTPGYLLSASLKLSDNLNISTIYRSKIEYKIEGTLTGSLYGTPVGQVPGEVRVVTPAEWRIGIGYRPFSSTAVDITYEKTFWGEYKVLDFNYANPLIEASAFGQPKDKYWHDTNTIRVGVRHKFNETFTGMAGIAYDETPIPQRTLGFELPDSNGWIYSLGCLWTPDNRLEIGLAYLYVVKIDRNVYTPPNENGINGKFTDMEAHLLNVSLGYKF
ncbi:OmpP1/FadL family transporter [Persephonella sp.]